MKKLIILGILATIGFSCTKENKADLRASQNEGPLLDSCVTTDLTYQNSIKSILSTNCGTSGCHAGPNGIGGLDLNTYSSAQRIAADGEMVGRIRNISGPLMPPSGKLLDCEIEKIEAWIADGAPNN
jgi:hypothetical protein